MKLSLPLQLHSQERMRLDICHDEKGDQTCFSVVPFGTYMPLTCAGITHVIGVRVRVTLSAFTERCQLTVSHSVKGGRVWFETYAVFWMGLFPTAKIRILEIVFFVYSFCWQKTVSMILFLVEYGTAVLQYGINSVNSISGMC